MRQSCENCGVEFVVTDDDLQFVRRMSPIIGGREHLILPPKLCPQHRRQRRMAFRNERNLFTRICDLSGERMLSSIPPTAPVKVAKSEHWWGDSWDGMDYGMEVDFSRPFFSQFKELFSVVPLEGLFTLQNENSEYTNLTSFNKNCYLIFSSTYNEECMYGRSVSRSRSSLDLTVCTNCELCYECLNCHNCWGLFFSRDCHQCSESQYLFQCVGCNNCLGCANLQHQEYCILNKPCDKAQYLKVLGEISSSAKARAEFAKRFAELVRGSIYRATQNVQTEDSVGDYICNSTRCSECFDVFECEDAKNCDIIRYGKDLRDCLGFSLRSELLYENHGVGLSNRVAFSLYCAELADCYYCAYSQSSKHLFGCVGLRKHKYCILNRQYSQGEYEAIIPKLIAHMTSTGEWGEFFPANLSPNGYNDTLAAEYFPLTKDMALTQGFNWNDYESPAPEVARVIEARELPETISDVDDSICESGVRCAESGKLFRITKSELEFYRKNNLPIPHLHPYSRLDKRTMLQGKMLLTERSCECCGKVTGTRHAADAAPHLYCDNCYRENVL